MTVSRPTTAAASTRGVVELTSEEWLARVDEHAARVEALVGPYLRSRARGEAHPVLDFLFTYYSARPSHVRRWHPGHGVMLNPPDHRVGRGDRATRILDEMSTLRGYTRTPSGGVTVDAAFLDARRGALLSTCALLDATAARPARLGCFGLHEWAMVYRTDSPRHEVPLRLGPAATDAVVESMPLRCTHFDAFRFFTDSARPRNETALTRDGQIDNEQPGCLHATMDLYRACITLAPLVPADLTFAAFELALVARELDMRASPYDLRALGYAAVEIETPAGRAEYVREQSDIAVRGADLRSRLRSHLGALLDAS
ncbi:hypothetical protein [Gordonia otitidis]|uniref:3-methyladenine DNA glycosylase n=1 Tax=Gordonia otitidis (strain DSM 44809 / CCUG 52243 / JCM 12355 / NBRC 100426 / IFM 10032) TaxID=1108044 RepID=H5TIS4_GORO1|nr:hypothetical protein GOOTI_064_00030 [Gordonia otitidis NBRC 100426]